jgi:hypothetical protein
MGDTYMLHPQMLALMREQSAAILAAKPWLAGPYAVPEPPKPVPELVPAEPVIELAPGQRARQFLLAELAVDPVPSLELQAKAKVAGIAWRTIRNVQKSVGVRVFKDKSGPWMWSLKEED